jgi:hypothetical protein
MNATRIFHHCVRPLWLGLLLWMLAIPRTGLAQTTVPTLTIENAPATTTTSEEFPGQFTVKTSNTTEFDAIIATSSDTSLITSVVAKRASGTQTVFWTVTYTTAKDKTGSADIRLVRRATSLAGPQVVVTATITPVDDPPTFGSGIPTTIAMDEDSEQLVNIPVDDVDSPEKS